ncbi:PQQ-binding-like beta-propeller repeat protein [Methanococcoides sp. SA1]|nr:PQQ-binding-like beta-propeller repeat protein [Methanococcoides sp. SA1]
MIIMNLDSKTIIMGIMVLFMLFAFCTPASASDWNTYLKNNHNNGITDDESPITAPESSVTWATKVGYTNTAPLVVENVVYVASKQGVYAIDKITGDVIWQSSMQNVDVIGNPTYGNNKIFVPTTSNGLLFAFDATTGNELWNISVGGTKYLLSPVKYDDGKIYFGDSVGWSGSDGTFYCYDENGNQLWSYASSTIDNSGYYFAGAALVNEYIVFGNSDGELVSLYKDNGTLVDSLDIISTWGDPDTKFVRSSITYSEEANRLYFTSSESGMAAEKGYCFAVGFGSISGMFDVSDKARAYIGATTSTPVIYNDRIYVGNATTWGAANGAIFCLDGDDLSNIWTFIPEGDAKFQSSAAISTKYVETDGSVYIYFISNTVDGSLYCLRDHADNFESIYRYSYTPISAMQQYTLGSASISNGRIYYANNEVAGNGGYLFSLATSESLDPDTVDWNPWNDLDSDGMPDGSYITISEVVEAYNCFKDGNSAPETGMAVSISMVIDIYNGFSSGISI